MQNKVVFSSEDADHTTPSVGDVRPSCGVATRAPISLTNRSDLAHNPNRSDIDASQNLM